MRNLEIQFRQMQEAQAETMKKTIIETVKLEIGKVIQSISFEKFKETLEKEKFKQWMNAELNSYLQNIRQEIKTEMASSMALMKREFLTSSMSTEFFLEKERLLTRELDIRLKQRFATELRRLENSCKIMANHLVENNLQMLLPKACADYYENTLKGKLEEIQQSISVSPSLNQMTEKLEMLQRDFYNDTVQLNREFASLSEKTVMLEELMNATRQELSVHKNSTQKLSATLSELENRQEIQMEEISSCITKFSMDMKRMDKGKAQAMHSIQPLEDAMTVSKFRAFRFAIVRDISEVKEAFANRIQSTQKNLELQVKMSENIKQGLTQLQEQMIHHEQQLNQFQKNNRSTDPMVERKIEKVMKEQKKLSEIIKNRKEEEIQGKIQMLMKALQMMAIRMDVLNPNL